MKVFNRFQKVIGWTGTASSLLICLVAFAHAEVVLDGTVGQKGAVSGPNYVITDKMGSQAGANLFHSFETFNINTGESGTFTGPGGIQNVIGRVTGGASSLIDGRLSCTIPGANLFLINPWGMMFGPNATLDVNGSFHASTADYLLLGDAGRFDAIHPEQSVLTVDPPSAFGFLDDTAASITVEGSYLKVPEGETLSLVGGDITLNDGTLHAPGGEIDLVSVASAGEVTLGASGPGMDSFERLGNINITRSYAEYVKIDDTEIGDVDVSGERGGVIYVRGGNFYVDGGKVYANTMGDKDSRGGIDVRVRDTVALDHGARISSMTYNSGNAGDILLEGTNVSLVGGVQVNTSAMRGSKGLGGDILVNTFESVSIEGHDAEGYPSGLFSNTLGSGDGGNITVTAPTFSLGVGGVIRASTYGSDRDAGNAGNITVNAREFDAKDGNIQSYTHGSGNGGNIKLSGTNISLTDGAQVNASAQKGSTGDGGSITINATGSVTIVGEDSEGNPSGIINDTSGDGDGGDIFIDSAMLLLGQGSQIRALTFGKDENAGNAGNIQVRTRQFSAKGACGIFTHTYGAGNAGNIFLTAENILLANNAQIGATAWEVSTGNGGNVTINAKSDVAIEGKNSGIWCNTSGSGNGGQIQIDAENLFLIDGAGIHANVIDGAEGDGATITVNARDSVNIEGEDGGPLTGIWSYTKGSGNGGNISVTASKVFLRNAEINAWAKSDGDAGDITVKTGELTSETGYLRSLTYGKGDGGNITVDAENISLTKGAQIDVSARQDSEGKAGEMNVTVSDTLSITGKDSGPGFLSGLYCSTYGKGDGGNIFVTASNISIGEDGAIAANTHRETDDAGDGGNIYITTEALNMKGNRAWIQSTTLGKGDAGYIKIDAKNISITDRAQISVSANEGTTGKAGDIIVNAAGSVTIGGKGTRRSPSGLFSNTSGKGEGGNIKVTASSLYLEQHGSIQTGTMGPGHGGSITVTADELYATETDVVIMASTAGSGHGGTITVKADELHATGGALFTADTFSTGAAGDILLEGTNISFRNGAQVGASARGGSTGKGGNIKVNATGSVSIAGKDSAGNQSGFFSGTDSVGEGGNIAVTTENLTVTEGATISAESSSTGNAGSINIHAGNLLSLDNGTIKTNAKKALGGNINITGKDIQLTHNSGISTSVKSGEGKGGNVTIDAATYVALENSDLTANADQGFGGDITINADAVFLSPDSDITASSQVSGKEGKIIVNSPVQDIVNAMVPLRESFLSADELLPERCETRDPEQAGSFIVDSSEGMPPRPDELLR